MLQRLKAHFSLFKDCIEEEQQRLETLTSSLMDTIENREQIHKILQERDIEGRPLYFLMKQHPLLLFKIETTIELEWEGDIPLYRRESLFLSTMARIFGIRVERPLARDTKCVICAEAKSLHSSSASLAARPCSNTLPTLLKYS